METKVQDDRWSRPVAECVRKDYVALRAESTVHEALESLRRQTLGERIVYFYVVDDEDRLRGVLPTRRLLMSAPDVRLEEIMHRRVVTVPGWLTHYEAGELFHHHRLLALPVVDESGRLLGIVDVTSFTDEMFDLAERHATEDMFQLIGVRLAQSRNVSPWASFRQRFPWLLCNVGGGLACALILGIYEVFLDNVIVLALFIPVVLAVSESVSMQSMSITLQALHKRKHVPAFLRRALYREVVIAALLGIGTGAVVGGTVYFWKGPFEVALAIGGTILLSVMSACLLGVALPVVVHAFRGDPRIAAGPIVLAAADLAALMLYFSLAGAILKPDLP